MGRLLPNTAQNVCVSALKIKIVVTISIFSNLHAFIFVRCYVTGNVYHDCYSRGLSRRNILAARATQQPTSTTLTSAAWMLRRSSPQE
ncbi:hypothetical protein Y032_0301g1833 [Ancylostoma ceylanicum]|uniref:Uncharacterized protein n=1 Tax=Ancylostoma ceylanicum TaxID=53326 RepID=A0A016S478_9BILA|nr:hypothetical protein Y032_0301g1833 [Ancylostoma ceylanicum]